MTPTGNSSSAKKGLALTRQSRFEDELFQKLDHVLALKS
jgi:hypothetical protein